MGDTRLIEQEIAALRPYERNARTHSKKQLKQIAASIERFGFTNPVLVSDKGEIIAGHGRALKPPNSLDGRRYRRWPCRISRPLTDGHMFSPTTSLR